MQVNDQELMSMQLIKSTNAGEIFQARTLGGLFLVFLMKSNGERQILAHAGNSLRSLVLAAKNRPDLAIPMIIKSQKDSQGEVIPESEKVKAFTQSVPWGNDGMNTNLAKSTARASSQAPTPKAEPSKSKLMRLIKGLVDNSRMRPDIQVKKPLVIKDKPKAKMTSKKIKIKKGE